MTKQLACKVDEVKLNTLMPVAMGRGTILLTRLPSGEIRAMGSRCPHQGANLAHGCLTGLSSGEVPNELHMERPGQILRCPWHGFEFDIMTGQSVADKGKLRLRRFNVEIENDEVYIVF